jgi:pyruvate/2-oxoglutarate dehydrogenase complex dihydrolipoamide dehydrogenase (E3) component
LADDLGTRSVLLYMELIGTTFHRYSKATLLRYRKLLPSMKTPHQSHQHYQLAVIGSGSGGREATLLAARKGLHIALIEGGKIGGACFHSGCYAVRALQACAHQFRDNLRSGRFGNHVDLLKTTLDDWMIAQQKASSRLTDAFRAELSELHVDLIEGYAEFLGDRLIQILGAGGSRTSIYCG